MVDSDVSHQLSYQSHYQRHDNCEELNLRIKLFCRNNNNIRPRVTCLTTTTTTLIYQKKYISDLNPTPDQNEYHARTQPWKTPLLVDSGREKHLSFNRNRWFWGPIKHPFSKQNAIIFPLYKIKYPFCESEIVFNIFFVYIVFFITSNLERIFKYSSQT